MDVLNYLDQQKEYIRCAIDPIYFIETYLSVFDQTQNSVVKFKLFDQQKDIINAYHTERLVICNKYRQAGVSTITEAYIAWMLLFLENQSIYVIADKLETARDELLKKITDFIEQLPDFLMLKTKSDTKTYKVYENGNRIKAMAPSRIRGPVPTLIFWDECAHTEKGGDFWTSTSASLATGGKCFLVSTPGGLDEVFYKTFENAKNKENEFAYREIWWYYDPRYNIDLKLTKDLHVVETRDPILIADYIRKGYTPTSTWYLSMCKKYNNDKKKISQELENSFIGSGNNFVDLLYVQEQETQYVRPPLYEEYIDKLFWIWEEPIPNAKYIIGVDVSMGTSEDYSAINILRIEENAMIQVAEYRGKIPPDVLGKLVATYAKRYNDGYVVVDVTGGIGIPTITSLVDEGHTNIHYSKMTYKPVKDRLNSYTKVLNGEEYLPGFIIGVNRGTILLEFERAIRMGELIIRSSRLISELKTFVSVTGTRIADHGRSFHDDSIFSTSIGIYVHKYQLNVNIMHGFYATMYDRMKVGVGAHKSEELKNAPPAAIRQANYGWLFK